MVEIIREIIQRYANVPGEKVLPSSSFTDDLGLSAADMAELAADLDDEYGVEISRNELASLNTVQNLLSMLQENGCGCL